MKLDFRNMDVGSIPFNYVRTLSVAGTGGAEVNECLLAAERIKDNNEESWVREWAIIAEKVAQVAEQAMQSGQTITARQAYLRVSNYYRTAIRLPICLAGKEKPRTSWVYQPPSVCIWCFQAARGFGSIPAF